MPATPQDRKPKATAVKPAPGYQFEVDGKSFTLPPITEKNAASVPGGVTMDLMLDPDDGQAQMSLAFHLLKAVEPTPAALAALRSLPTEEMMEHVGNWMGESSGSSD